MSHLLISLKCTSYHTYGMCKQHYNIGLWILSSIDKTLYIAELDYKHCQVTHISTLKVFWMLDHHKNVYYGCIFVMDVFDKVIIRPLITCFSLWAYP